jgi:hypothetical protein
MEDMKIEASPAGRLNSTASYWRESGKCPGTFSAEEGKNIRKQGY